MFAAASLTETLNAIGECYTAEHPEVTFRFNFDSSGTLKTQIQEGADCDLFISAGQKQMNQLDITASADVNKDGLDFVDADSLSLIHISTHRTPQQLNKSHRKRKDRHVVWQT